MAKIFKTIFSSFFLTIFGIIFTVIGFWFNNTPVLNAAILSIPDVCNDNTLTLQTNNEVTCYSQNTGAPRCFVHAECCASCVTDTAVCVISKPPRSEADLWAYTSSETDNSTGYVSSCTDILTGYEAYCSRTASGSCPTGYSAASYEGYNCGVYKEKDVDNIYSAMGFWNASEQECITCSGKKKDKVCATTGGFFLDGSGNCNGLGGSGTFQKACDSAVAPACDDKVVDANCGGTDFCNSSGQCVASAACTAVAPTVTVTPATYNGPAGAQTFNVKVTRNDVNCPAGKTISGDITCSGGSPTPSTFTTAALDYGEQDTGIDISVNITTIGNCEFTAQSPDNSSHVYQGSQTVNFTVSNCSGVSVSLDKTSYLPTDTPKVTFGSDNNNKTNFCVDVFKTVNGYKSFYSDNGNNYPDGVYTYPINIANQSDLSLSGVVAGDKVIATITSGTKICSTSAPCRVEVPIVAATTTCSDGTCDNSASPKKYCVANTWTNCSATQNCVANTGCVNSSSCSSNADCTNSQYAHCDTSSGNCYECSSDSDCAHISGKPKCDTSKNPHECIAITAQPPAMPACLETTLPGDLIVNYKNHQVGDSLVLKSSDGTRKDCKAISNVDSNGDGTVVFSGKLDAYGDWSVITYRETSSCPAIFTTAPLVTSTTKVQQESCAAPPVAVCSGVNMFTSPLGVGYCTISQILAKATDWILSLVASIIILIIIIGGIMYISSAGDEEKLRTSKNIIFYAILGLGIILVSYALITEVTKVLKG